MDTATAPRIPVEEAHRKVVAGDALLVCAYDDDRCKQLELEGSITRRELESRLLPSIPQDSEIIFYCA
jgi:hypothetical protein